MSVAGIQQIAGVVAVDGRHPNGVAHAQVVKLIELRRRIAGSIQLVDAEYHRLFGPLEHGGHILVGCGDAGAHISDENDHIGGIDGDERLLPHEFQNFVVGFGLDTAGVDKLKHPAPPFTLGIDPVPGDAGSILHNGLFPADEPVKKHGLAHIGPSHNGNDRLSHSCPLSILTA